MRSSSGLAMTARGTPGRGRPSSSTRRPTTLPVGWSVDPDRVGLVTLESRAGRQRTRSRLDDQDRLRPFRAWGERR